jgi:hypothetical protein
MDPRAQKPSSQIDKALDGKIRDAAREGRSVGKTTIEAQTGSGRTTVVVDDADKYGVLAGPVSSETPGGKPSAVPAQAAEAVKKINYLQEPLAVIETEDRRGRGILRSATPRQVEGGREYNEAILDGGGSITIRRFRAESGSRRRQVPSNLSRETLGRLVDDLGEILQPK